MDRSRVLVVEDVRHIAHFVQHNLKKAGYETRVESHGDRVLAAVAEFAPHAVLLDMVLPGLSGLEICKALRADPAQANLRIIIVTGHSFDDASADDVKAAGADWSFTKPISPVNMLAKLRELGVPAKREEVAS